MLEVEIQKLTAAITALTEELRSAKVGNELPTETSTNFDKPRQVTQAYREALVVKADDTAGSFAHRVSRAATTLRNDIFAILEGLENNKKAYAEAKQFFVDFEDERLALVAEQKREYDVISSREDDAARRKMQDERKANRRAGKVTKEEVEALVEAAKPVENTECADQPLKDKVEEVVSAITAEDLKTVAMEIARADSSARPLILSILSEHGAKTITQLDPKHYQEVHARFLSLAYDIAKNGEVA